MRTPHEVADLFERATRGDRAVTGKLLSAVERGGDIGRWVSRLAFPMSRKLVQVVGITGSPGTGKSTLASALVGAIRSSGERVGILAVDPSSPFSGGAILGDRVRMQEHATDDGVFVRSMASRGHLGGLALAAPEAVRLLGAAGYPIVLLETVGVGQVEIEVAGSADTTVVVVNPGWGDSVQASKAGLLEVADVLVVNKSDLPGAERARKDLSQMLDLGLAQAGWRPPIVLVDSVARMGVDELWEAVVSHRRQQESSGSLEERRRSHLLQELDRVVLRRIEADVRDLGQEEGYQELARRVTDLEIDPYDAAGELLRIRSQYE